MGQAAFRQQDVFLFAVPLSKRLAWLRVKRQFGKGELQATLGLTSLYMPHDEVTATSLVDRIIVMNGGILEQPVASLDLCKTPQSLPAMQVLAVLRIRSLKPPSRTAG